MKAERRKEIKLIDGVFTPNEASSLLVTMIDNKINFHKLDDFSYHIREDRHPHHSQERVVELQEAKADLRAWLNNAKEQSSHLVVKGVITVELNESVSQSYTFSSHEAL